MLILFQVNTLGLSILTETLKSAAFYMSNTLHHVNQCTKFYTSHFNSEMKEGSECLAFIQGTGLELILERYCLDYNPDKLRDKFFHIMKKIGSNGYS